MYTSIVLVAMLGPGAVPGQPAAGVPVWQGSVVRHANPLVLTRGCASGRCVTVGRVVLPAYRSCPGGVCGTTGTIIVRPRYYGTIGTSYAPVSVRPISYGGYCPTCVGAVRPISTGCPGGVCATGGCPGGVCRP